MIFKLDKYYNLTRYKYVYADTLMTMNKVDKPSFLHSLGIDYDVFRVEKARDKVNNLNVNKILEHYQINPIIDTNKSKYEKCINNMYYAIYFKEADNINKYIDELNIYIAENNYLKPLFVLFKTYGNMNIDNSIDDIRYIINNDLDYINNFRKNYYIDEFELIYEAVLIPFKEDKDLTKISNLGLKYEKLNWIHLVTKGAILYMSQKDNDAYRCYQALEKEFESTRNVERLMSIHSNMCFIHNSLGDYQESVKLTSKTIEYIYTSKKSIWVDNILMHYLFSNFMLGRYDDIIKLYSEEIFDISRLNWVTASICILASFLNKELNKASEIIDLFRNDEYVAIVLNYIKTGNRLLLVDLKQTPLIKKIIQKLD